MIIRLKKVTVMKVADVALIMREKTGFSESRMPDQVWNDEKHNAIR